MFCIIESFSHVTGLSPEMFYNIIGHDGKEIVKPGMMKPYCYRSFTPSEISFVLFVCQIKYVRLLESEYKKVKGLEYYDLVAFKGSHCIGLKNGVIRDTQNKIKELSQFLPCSEVVIF